MTDKLLPCPFCGGENLKAWNNGVECKDCDCHWPDLGHVGGNARAEAIARWNRRSPAPQSNVSGLSLLDAMREAFDMRPSFAQAWFDHLKALGDVPPPSAQIKVDGVEIRRRFLDRLLIARSALSGANLTVAQEEAFAGALDVASELIEAVLGKLAQNSSGC